MKPIQKDSLFLLFPFLVFCVSCQLPFFWDSIYYSRVADWILQTHFSSMVLPVDLDTGHPPFFAFLLALSWKIFGKSLLVSHLLMLPFLTGITWQIIRLCRRFLGSSTLFIAIGLLLIEPTLLTQMTMVSPEPVLIFFYLLGLNSILDRRLFLVFASVLCLCLLNLRGLTCGGALLISGVLLMPRGEEKWPFVKKIFFSSLLPISLSLIWYGYHASKTGWWFMTPSKFWDSQRKILGLQGFMKNTFIFLWRMCDMGRLIVWAVLGYIVIKHKKSLFLEPKTRVLFCIFLVPLCVLFMLMAPFSNPIGHRYLIILYSIGLLLTLFLLERYVSVSAYKKITALILIFFLSGHFWIYPDGVAKGWDSTLSHLYYFPARKEMIEYIRNEKIDPAGIGSEFPNEFGYRFSDLDNSQWKFHPYNINVDTLIFESNVFNGFSNAHLQELRSTWVLRKEIRKGPVYVRLYHRPKQTK